MWFKIQVTQGHWKWYHWKLGYAFLFAFHSKYGRIFSLFGDIQRQRMAWYWNMGRSRAQPLGGSGGPDLPTFLETPKLLRQRLCRGGVRSGPPQLSWRPPNFWGNVFVGGVHHQASSLLVIIWSIDSQENHWNSCHQMPDFNTKMHQNRFRLGLRWLGYHGEKTDDIMWSRFHLIPERHGRTELL